MKHAIELEELRSNFWIEAGKGKKKPEVSYDNEIDTLFFYFTDPGTGTVVTHYLDSNVAILFRLSDKEIVGLSIEGFERSFTAKYSNSAWLLSKTGTSIKGIKDFGLAVREEQQTHATRPIENFTVKKDIRIQPQYAFA